DVLSSIALAMGSGADPAFLYKLAFGAGGDNQRRHNVRGGPQGRQAEGRVGPGPEQHHAAARVSD
ncbi:hypothetical protein, partial [Proteus mirabilis]|uniref:hypothetical protein n=1 Tax=Proteus mirabilis TaxID=584 RepID=UPI001EF8EC4F